MRASFVASMPVLGATKRLTANGGRYLCENAAEVRLGLPQVFCRRGDAPGRTHGVGGLKHLPGKIMAEVRDTSAARPQL